MPVASTRGRARAKQDDSVARSLDTVTRVSTDGTQSESRLGNEAPPPPLPGALLLFSDRAPLFRPLTLVPGVPVRYGRSDFAGVRVPDSRVSKEHLELRFADGVFHLEDLESSNGSYLNGVRFEGKRTAQPGSVLRLAQTVLVLLADVRRFLTGEVRREELGKTPRPVVVGPTLQEAFDLATVARQRSANLLILGENGTGKELVAEHYHRASTPRGPFVPLNCATITPHLAEGVLFGTRKGAYTEARDSDGLMVAADGGVLFLDEVVELSPEVQVKLLRVAESGEVMAVGETKTRHVSVRFVTASHQDLRRRTAEGRFREDLFFRLNQASLTLKPLRERREEMPSLMQLDVEGEGALPLHATAIELALLRRWPGNLRELRAATREALARAIQEGDTAVRAKHFPEQAGLQLSVVPTTPPAGVSVPPGPPVPAQADDERRWPTKEEIVATLAANGNNKSAAARQMELHREQLKRLMRKYELISTDDVE